jgi:hypothetical protein
MKKTVIVILLVLAFAVVAIYFLGLLPLSSEKGGEEESISVPPPTPPTPPPPAPVTPPSSPPPPAVHDVKFEFLITDISGSGLSRTVTAEVTNTGSDDAHNCWAKTEVFSKESRIKIGGEAYLRENIGTIKAGTAVTRRITLEFSAFDGLKISQNGARFELTISSDEHTQTFSYDYQP